VLCKNTKVPEKRAIAHTISTLSVLRCASKPSKRKRRGLTFIKPRRSLYIQFERSVRSIPLTHVQAPLLLDRINMGNSLIILGSILVASLLFTYAFLFIPCSSLDPSPFHHLPCPLTSLNSTPLTPCAVLHRVRESIDTS
jgi:hypothetical protein